MIYSVDISAKMLSVMTELSYLNLSERMPEYDLQAYLDRVVPNPKLLTKPDPPSLSYSAM